MGLADPRLNYTTLWDAIIDLLKASMNDTYLNKDMTKNTKQVIAGDPFIVPVPVSMYPTIMVNLIRKIEESRTVGGNRKQANIPFRIYGITERFKTWKDAAYESAQFLDNIEAVFRDNKNINGNVLYCNPTDADFGEAEVGKGVYVHMAMVDVECIKRAE